MLGYFKNNELRKIDVFGNGETVYVLKDESELITGVNTVSCSEMRIDVKVKNIQRISFQKSLMLLYTHTKNYPKNGSY